MVGKLTVSAFVLSALLIATQAQTIPDVSGPKYTTIDVPGATFTSANDINTTGEIVGPFVDTRGARHGFLLSGGVFTTIDVPSAKNTNAWGINDSDQIVGSYNNGNVHGFLLSEETFTTLDFPGAVATESLSINNSGQIVGFYLDQSFVYHGFELSGGTYSTIDPPGSILTEMSSISNAGEVVGLYEDAGGVFHGVFLDGGVYTNVDFPKAVGTFAYGINEPGTIVGNYETKTTSYGFEFAQDNFVKMTFPGATSTASNGINLTGTIVGSYTDVSGVTHGFVLTPTTATTLASSPNPSTEGHPVTFSAVVSSSAGVPPDGETVSFLKGKTVLGTGTLSGGIATFTTSTLKVGTTSVKATYGGDPNFGASESKVVKQVVENAVKK